MKKFFPFLIFILCCPLAQADSIILKDGRIIEGEIIQIRSSYVRIRADYNQPFREFLVENIAEVIQTGSSQSGSLVIGNIHRWASNEANNARLQETVQNRANELIEQAIQNSKVLSIDGVSDEVKAAVREKVSALIGEAVKDNDMQLLGDASAEIQALAQEKATVLIGEAVRNVETPALDKTPAQIREIAQQKAGGLIEQAVKTVEVSPFHVAPEGARLAAKQAASILIEEAFLDEKAKRSRPSITSGLDAPSIILRHAVPKDDKTFFSVLGSVAMNPLTGGLLALFFVLIVIMVVRIRIAANAIRAEDENEPQPENSNAAAPSEPVLVSAEQQPPAEVTPAVHADVSAPEMEAEKAEKRSHPRIQWDIPVDLHMDKIKPITAVIKNLSLGGAFVRCNDFFLFKAGDCCRFSLNLSDKDPNLAINSTVEIVRINPSRGLGLKFLDLKGNSFNYLKQVLA